MAGRQGAAPGERARLRKPWIRVGAPLACVALVVACCLGAPRAIGWQIDRETGPHRVSLRDVGTYTGLRFPAGTRLESSSFTENLFGEWELTAAVDIAAGDVAWFQRTNGLPLVDVEVLVGDASGSLCGSVPCAVVGYARLAGDRVRVDLSAMHD